MEQKRFYSPPVSGICSLLVIFAVLVLSIFMMLTVTTVQADKRLSDACLDAVDAYYEADLQAEEIFARLRNGEMLAQVQQSGNTYRYACPISQAQQLVVTLQREENGWHVLQWQAMAASMEEISETLPVWDGNKMQEENND